MEFKRKIIPSARFDLSRIGTDYGLSASIDTWTRQIVTEAHLSVRPRTGQTELDLDTVFVEIEDIGSSQPSDWTHSWRAFVRAGWLEKMRILRSLLANRSPPCQLKFNTRVFHALGEMVPVEVEAYYEINYAARTVTFRQFEAYTPTLHNVTVSSEAADW